MNLVGSLTGGSPDRIVVRKFDERGLLTAVVLDVVDYCQHLDHRVVHTLHFTVAIWVVGAGGNFPNPKQHIDGMHSFEQNWRPLFESMVRGDPQRGIYQVDENVSRAITCEVGCSGCEHVGSAAETIGEK